MEKEVEGKILEAQKIEITEYYIYKKLADSVAKDMNFKKEFYTMALISLSIAAISFVIGYLIRILFGIEI